MVCVDLIISHVFNAMSKPKKRKEENSPDEGKDINRKEILKALKRLPGSTIVSTYNQVGDKFDKDFKYIVNYAQKIIGHRKRTFQETFLFYLTEIKFCKATAWIPEKFFSTQKNLVFDYFETQKSFKKILISQFWTDFEKSRKKQLDEKDPYMISFVIPNQDIFSFIADEINIIGAAVKDGNVLYRIQNCKDKKQYWVTSDQMKKHYPNQLIQFLEKHIEV